MLLECNEAIKLVLSVIRCHLPAFWKVLHFRYLSNFYQPSNLHKLDSWKPSHARKNKSIFWSSTFSYQGCTKKRTKKRRNLKKEKKVFEFIFPSTQYKPILGWNALNHLCFYPFDILYSRLKKRPKTLPHCDSFALKKRRKFGRELETRSSALENNKNFSRKWYV